MVECSRNYEHPDYLTGTIAWESDLQASIYRALRIRCPDASVFLEARMLPGESRIDLVLCEASVVRLIAEIKFVPQGYPEWKPDIQKLNAIAQLEMQTPKSSLFAAHSYISNPSVVNRKRCLRRPRCSVFRIAFLICWRLRGQRLSRPKVWTTLPGWSAPRSPVSSLQQRS